MKQIILLLVLSVAFPVRSQLEVRDVYLENKKTPVGIQSSNPRMSWILDSDKRATRQVAYEIRVADSEAGLQSDNALHWHSGKVASGQSVHVPYSGKALQSGKVYFWQVRVWDNHNRTSKWSAVDQWQMGLLDPAREFQARWITPGFEEDTLNRPSPYFRKEFSLTSKSSVKRATAYITAHGMYEAELNGQRVGDAYLNPGWTSYDTRLQYQMYDVTKYLVENNAIGVVLGKGWYPCFNGVTKMNRALHPTALKST